MYETFLSSTNHPMVHWCSSINLVAMHRLYGSSLSPTSNSFVENKSHHRGALSNITYISFNIRTYSTFLLFSYITNVLYYGFTSHTIFTNSPSIFMCTTLSSGGDAWRYENIVYNLMVGDVAYFSRIWLRWRLLYMNVLPLILPHRFFKIGFTALSSLYFSWQYIIFASWVPKTSRFSNCLY